mmetsp:Transcript_27343/g.79737  ORF Transcript_27343/g.79737 Transcript_27343/m.79737 type:complete len:254 (+) Transcript_27343:929-1690(+)
MFGFGHVALLRLGLDVALARTLFPGLAIHSRHDAFRGGRSRPARADLRALLFESLLDVLLVSNDPHHGTLDEKHDGLGPNVRRHVVAVDFQQVAPEPRDALHEVFANVLEEGLANETHHCVLRLRGRGQEGDPLQDHLGHVVQESVDGLEEPVDSCGVVCDLFRNNAPHHIHRVEVLTMVDSRTHRSNVSAAVDSDVPSEEVVLEELLEVVNGVEAGHAVVQGEERVLVPIGRLLHERVPKLLLREHHSRNGP